MSFKKGQTITIKKRGAASELKQYAGTTFTVVRGGKTVTISATSSNVFGFGYNESAVTTLKVNALTLAASVKKSK